MVKVDNDIGQTEKKLTEHRILLLQEVATNVLRRAGYVVGDERFDHHLRFTRKFASSRDKILVQCGLVLNEKGWEADVAVDDYIKKREEDMRSMAEQKYWEPGKDVDIHNLGVAATVFELIQVKSNNSVKLNTEDSIVSRREESSKGASFILYNCARIITIRKKFESGVEKGQYPALPQEVGASLLREEEEWHLLFDFLLEYPSLIRRTAENLVEGKVDIHHLCGFTVRFCQTFSVYYRRFRILVEKEHLFPTMFARLQLLRAIEYVLEHILNTLNIKIMEHM